jgi:hypothetical protein
MLFNAFYIANSTPKLCQMVKYVIIAWFPALFTDKMSYLCENL